MSELAAAGQPDSRRALNVNLTTRTVLVVAAFVLVFGAFISIASTLLTLFLAVFSALVLDPVVRLMERHSRFGRGGNATILVLGLTAIAIVAAIFILAPLVKAFADFVDDLPQIVDDIKSNSHVTSWIDQHSSAPETSQENAQAVAKGIASHAGGLLGVAVSAFSLVLMLVTSIFLTLFLLIDLPRLIDAVDSLLDPRGSERWGRTSERIITAVSRTMLGNIAISIICGTIYGVSAWILGTPYPVVMGVIAGLLDLIPMIGATIAGIILVLATLTQGLTPALIMLGIVLVYQQFENYVLQPTILGKAADVSGFIVIASVMLIGTLLGVIGAIIAVPIAASIQIAVKEFTAERRAAMAELRTTNGLPPPAT